MISISVPAFLLVVVFLLLVGGLATFTFFDFALRYSLEHDLGNTHANFLALMHAKNPLAFYRELHRFVFSESLS